MSFDWAFAADILPDLLDAARVTLLATLLGFALALAAGLMLALLKRSRHAWVRRPVWLVSEFIRSTPLLVQLYVMYFILPDLGLALPALTTGVLGLGLHYGTYVSEVYRAGIDGVPRGQWEAAAALNMTTAQTYRRIILPQAIPPVIPVLGNYLIAIFKETPLLSAIAVVEMMQTAKILGSDNFQYLEPVTLVGAFFLVFSLLSAALVRWLERRLPTVRAR